MATFDVEVDRWTHEQLEAVVQEREQESVFIDFKRDLNTKGEGKKDLAKDISAMANTAGGWILYGVDETKGGDGVARASALTPMTSPPKAAEWIGNILASTVIPPIEMVRIREVPSSDGSGFFVVVRVWPSSNAVHMVTTENRYYRRDEKSARPMSEPEVRDRYEIVLRRRQQLKEHVSSVVAADTADFLEGANFYFALVPHTFSERISLEKFTHLSEPAFTHLESALHSEFRPYQDGLQAEIAPHYRLRVRRDGTVSNMFPNDDPEMWFPLAVLGEVLNTIVVAKKLWPARGIFDTFTLIMRVRLPKSLPPAGFHVPHRNSGVLLPSDLRFELEGRPDALATNPISLGRAVMDRLYQAMGKNQCLLFDGSGNLPANISHNLPNNLRRELTA